MTATEAGANADLGNPQIAPPQSAFRGHTYGEWSASWFRWVMSLPFTHHPLFDSPGVDCSEGQTGDVWFIGGHLGGTVPANRSCTIPAGTALFLNISANGPVDNTGCDPTGTFVAPTTSSIEELRAFARHNLNLFLDDRGRAEIDDIDVQHVSGLDPPYRVQSSVFGYTVPAVDNLLVLINGPCYNNAAASDLAVDGAVADGVYVMIKPLSIGHHTISFGNPGGVALGNVYHITVTGDVTGSASRVGVIAPPGKENAQVSIVGSMNLDGPLNLGTSRLTIESLIAEVGLGGVGELARGVGGADMFPLTLAARPGGTANAAIFATPSGARPSVRAEIKNRDPEKALLEFKVKLDRGTIPAAPDLCAGQPLTTNLATTFKIDDGVNPPVILASVRAWRCSDVVGGDPQEPRSLRVP